MGDPIAIGQSSQDHTVSSAPEARTRLLVTNPADGTGKLTEVHARFYTVIGGYSGSGKIGTFYGSGTSWQCRDYVSWGPTSNGTIDLTGLEIEVEEGDVIGIFYPSFNSWYKYIYYLAGSSGNGMFLAGDQFSGGPHTFTASSYRPQLWGVGETLGYGHIVVGVESPDAVNGVPGSDIAEVLGV